MQHLVNQFNKVVKQENQLKNLLLSSISIYQNNSKIVPIKNIETLKLFNKIDQAFNLNDKQRVLESVEEFMLNKEGRYNEEYGAAKDQLESLLKFNSNKICITNHEVLQQIGFIKQEITVLGLKESRNDIVTKAFELISLRALKDKYEYIKDITYCDDGKTKIILGYSNATSQKNVDYILKIIDSNNQEYFIAFDHKVKDLQSCIKDIQNNGFKYSVFTLGDVSDQTFYENPAVKQQLITFDFGKILNNKENRSNPVERLLEKEAISELSEKKPQLQILMDTLSNISKYEQTGNKEILLKTPLMPVLLINSQDIQKKVFDLQCRVGARKYNKFTGIFEDI